MPAWPKEYGGAGLTPAQAKVLREEMAAIKARPPLSSFGIWMLGPALLHFGTEGQKQRFLNEIARGEIRWCQGYSEPGSGLGSGLLQTFGEDKGDHWVVNGQKVWTSYADKADWIFCLVRTDKENKYQGITFMLYDMANAGVSTKPILLISGNSPFCETFFDDVKVPKSYGEDVPGHVGEVNRGWDVAKYLLGHEREMISGADGGNTAAIGALKRNGAIDPVLRAELAQFDVDALAYGAMGEKFLDEIKVGKAHPAQPNMMKYAGTELNKRRHELMMAAGGSRALEWESEETERRQALAQLAADQGEQHRGRHVRSHAQRHFQTYPRLAREPDRCLFTTTTTRRCWPIPLASSWPRKVRSRTSCATGATATARMVSATACGSNSPKWASLECWWTKTMAGWAWARSRRISCSRKSAATSRLRRSCPPRCWPRPRSSTAAMT